MYKKKAEGWIKHIDFILLDLVCLGLSFCIACAIRHGISDPFANADYRSLFLILQLVNLLVILVFDTFKGVMRRGIWQEFIQTLLQAVLVFLIVIAYMFVTKQGEQYSRIIIALTALFYLILAFGTRLFWKHVIHRQMSEGRGDALLLMSSLENADALVREVQDHNYAANRIVGIAVKANRRPVSGSVMDEGNSSDDESNKEILGIPVVFGYLSVLDYVKKNWVDEVLISVGVGEDLPQEIIEALISMGVTVHVHFNRYSNTIVAKQAFGKVGDLPVLTMSMNYMTTSQRFFKRFLDILGGLVGCLFTGVLYLFIAPKIKKESPGPVFFSQIRIGQNGRPFKFYKFRSMYLDAEERKKELMEQNRVKDGMMFKMNFDPRVIGNKIDENGNQVTGIGDFLRRTSLDEFPQFYNVLKGDMSLVGTRPPTVDEFEKYSVRHKARLAARPGITGLWQVSGRSNILDFEEVVKLDTQYINNWSIGLDLKILFQTIRVVFEKEGSM